MSSKSSKSIVFFIIVYTVVLAAACNKEDADTSKVTKIAEVENLAKDSNKSVIVRGEVEILMGTMDTFYVTIVDSSGSIWLAMDNNAPGAREINLYTYGEFEILRSDNIKKHPKMKDIKVEYRVKRARAVTTEASVSL